jgi:carboxyvinyl-carboxyphosphonate phosphorylmutase
VNGQASDIWSVRARFVGWPSQSRDQVDRRTVAIRVDWGLTMSLAREHLRELLSGSDCHPMGMVFNPLSARIAELAGFSILHLSGSVGKAANLGLPDSVPMSNMSDLVEMCWRITRVSPVSLEVDADDGGGGPLNVLRTVQDLEAIGVAGIEIEDNLVPERFGPYEASADETGMAARVAARHSRMIPKEAQVAKLRAAVAARRDPSTVIVARTSALQMGSDVSLADGLDRVQSYADSGVDALMLIFPRGREEIRAVRRVTSLPLIVAVSSASATLDTEFLAANNVRLRFTDQLPFRMALKAMYDAYSHLKNGTGNIEELQARAADRELWSAVTRTLQLTTWQRTYTSE